MIVVVGGVLGLAVAGFPSRRDDAPIRVQAVATTTATSMVVVVTTTTTATTAPTPARSSASVRVTVFNASGIPGSATRVGSVVKGSGYDLKAPGADRKAQDSTVIMYRPGYDSEARALAAALRLDPTVVSPLDAGVASPDTTDLGVIVGTDLAKHTN